MGYEIQKGIPLPTGKNQNYAPVYNWDKMTEVGDSFFVPAEEGKVSEEDFSVLRRRVYNAARAYGKPRNMDFKAMVVEETQPNPKWTMSDGDEVNGPQQIKVKGVRCWLMSLPPVLEITKTDEGDQTLEPQV